MKTRHEEEVKETSEISEMKGMFLAEKLRRSWKEDFVDEDSGEVVTIDRFEVLFNRGTQLTNKELTEINFMLQSGDIKSVKVSNIERGCEKLNTHTSLWVCTILLNSKKKNIYLYASSIEMAMDICADYVEQFYSGCFSFAGIKKLEFSHLLYEDEIENKSEGREVEVYKMEIEIEEDQNSYSDSFIVHGTDAENCKDIIYKFLLNQRAETKRATEFELKIISAKTIPCNYIIEPSFCNTYIEE